MPNSYKELNILFKPCAKLTWFEHDIKFLYKTEITYEITSHKE